MDYLVDPQDEEDSPSGMMTAQTWKFGDIVFFQNDIFIKVLIVRFHFHHAQTKFITKLLCW